MQLGLRNAAYIIFDRGRSLNPNALYVVNQVFQYLWARMTKSLMPTVGKCFAWYVPSVGIELLTPGYEYYVRIVVG